MIIECTSKNLASIIALLDQKLILRLSIRKCEKSFMMDVLQAARPQDEVPYHHFAGLNCLQDFKKMFELQLVEDFTFFYEVGKGGPIFSYSYKKQSSQTEAVDYFKQIQYHLDCCFDLLNQVEATEDYLVEDLYTKPKGYNRYRPVTLEQSIQYLQSEVSKYVK